MKTKFFYILFALLLLPIQASADSILDQAHKAYEDSQYAQAITLYETYLTQEVRQAERSTSPELSDCYYNLGNCYYRSKNWGKAVLNYQRALRTNPGNEDAEFNLTLTQVKLKDQFDTPSEMFFLSWAKSLIASKNATQWGTWGFIFLLLTLALFSLYFFGKHIKLRKIGLFIGSISLVLLLIFHLFAFLQYRAFTTRESVVVLDDVDTYEAPSSTGKKLQTLHEGTTLLIEETLKEGKPAHTWYNVILPNGTEAWIKNEHVEKVADLSAQSE